MNDSDWKCFDLAKSSSDVCMMCMRTSDTACNDASDIARIVTECAVLTKRSAIIMLKLLLAIKSNSIIKTLRSKQIVAINIIVYKVVWQWECWVTILCDYWSSTTFFKVWCVYTRRRRTRRRRETKKLELKSKWEKANYMKVSICMCVLYDWYVLYVSLRWYYDGFVKNITWHMI